MIIAYFFASILSFLIVCSYVTPSFEKMFAITNSLYIYSFLVVIMLYSRNVCVFFVRLYQRYAASEIRLRCRMIPSCSDYSILAFKKYGTIVGLIKTIGRLKRCNKPAKIDFP